MNINSRSLRESSISFGYVNFLFKTAQHKIIRSNVKDSRQKNIWDILQRTDFFSTERTMKRNRIEIGAEDINRGYVYTHTHNWLL